MKPVNISHTFRSADEYACGSIESKKVDLARAREIAPALVSSIEAEIQACEKALERARAAASDYDREFAAAERALAEAASALAEFNTSHEVSSDAASRIVHAAECAKYIRGAYKRRADAAHSAATSGYARASKDVAERNAAVNYAERLAGAVVDRDPGRLELEKRPGVIAWLRLVFPVEGRAAYARSVANRAGNRSYPEPPPMADYDDTCRSFFAQIEGLRDQAARQAADLAAVSP